jgi:hypothetical protein
MGREDTPPRILNPDNNNTAAVSFTHRSFVTFVTGGSKQKTRGNKEERGKKKSEFI